MRQEIKIYTRENSDRRFKVELNHIQADQYLCLIWDVTNLINHKLKATIHSNKQTCVVMTAKFMNGHNMKLTSSEEV